MTDLDDLPPAEGSTIRSGGFDHLQAPGRWHLYLLAWSFGWFSHWLLFGVVL